MFYFQDGEHGGTASREEINSGFEEGEVSEKCVIFDVELDSWLPIGEFLRKHTVPINAVENPKPCNRSPAIVMRIEPDHVIQNFGKAQDRRNKGKKPPRDNSTWGQSNILDPVITMCSTKIEEERKECSDDAQVDLKNNASGVTLNVCPARRKKGVGIKPPPKLMRMITQAIIQWNMIEEGDRLLLGLSGGKDSMTLLHCLLEFQRKLPISFTIEVCTIDPMTPSFDPSPLIPYVESLGLTYHYIRDDIVARANSSGKDGKIVSSLCAFCARMKRGNLYSCARQNKCNKLVLAQHLDDCAESFLMSVMHNGFLRTMKANYKINVGDMSVIRPMVYCRESLMSEFAKSANLPVINENCPACFEEPKERARIKKLLSREEALFPNFYDNIRRSLIPLMHEDSTAILRCYTEEAVSKSRRESNKKVDQHRAIEVKARRNGVNNEGAHDENNPRDGNIGTKETNGNITFAMASDEDLIMEIARRKADKFRLSDSMQKSGGGDYIDGFLQDPTGQVCSLNGGNGSIPCRELME